MPTFRTVLAGNVTDKWTKKGREQEMAALSQVLTSQAVSGWRLHSVQPVPVFGGFSDKQTGTVLPAVFEAS
jgi:hypothetical protein